MTTSSILTAIFGSLSILVNVDLGRYGIINPYKGHNTEQDILFLQRQTERWILSMAFFIGYGISLSYYVVNSASSLTLLFKILIVTAGLAVILVVPYAYGIRTRKEIRR